MKTSKSPRPESAVAIGDGYVGMNIIPQKLGRQAGLEHSAGPEVEDIEKVVAVLREKYPLIQLIKRPTNPPSPVSAPMIRKVTCSICPSKI